MNPDKLFDYLDGKLSPAEREQVEEKLASDPQLQRQLAIARQIHRGMGGTREVLAPNEDPQAAAQSGVFGRRVAIAAAALVLLNVFVGIAFIVGKNKKSPNDFGGREAEIRQQLLSSLGKTAEAAMPTPTFEVEEIKLIAPLGEQEAIAGKVIAAATECGGSAVRALPEEKGVTILAEIPSVRARDFRRAVSSLGASDPTAAPTEAISDSDSSKNAKTIVQVRITERK